MKSVDILISTSNERIDYVEQILKPVQHNVNYIIGHQVYGIYKEKISTPKIVDIREDIKYFRSEERGISKNRNITIDNARADISVIADDDIKYFDNTFENIVKYHNLYPKASVIIFQIQTLDSNKPFKAYPATKFWLTKKDASFVNSIEITFKTQDIKNKGISFNENFGLGSKLTGGEENLFILDCINSGLNVLYIPIPIVIHPKETSGRNKKLFYSESGTRTRGANAYIHYRNFYWIYMVYYLFKHYKNYRSNFSMKKSLELMLEGVKIAKDSVK